jgi:hypothetical protein
VYTPITIVKRTPAATTARNTTTRAVGIQSVPTGQNATFDLSISPAWPSGLPSPSSLRVRVFEASIYDNGLQSVFTYDPALPLAVYPGSTSTSKLVSVSSSSGGSVTVNIPENLGGIDRRNKNFILISGRDIASGGVTYRLGGATVFPTNP